MLGKGLESLIPKKQNTDHDDYARPSVRQDDDEIKEGESLQEANSFSRQDDIPRIEGPIFHIEIEKIEANPYQPRTVFDQEALKELASSIREFGILQPLVLAKIEEDNEFGTRVRYQLIAGHRRLLASKMLGLSTVPAVIKNALKKTEALEMAVVENIQRADLNVIETARAYARLSDEFNFTQREIAQRLGKSRESIANTLRLLSLPSEIQDALSNGVINESQARLLMAVDDPNSQRRLFDQLVSENLSVRELRRRIESARMQDNSQEREGETIKVPDMQLQSIEKEISEFLGAPVKVEFSRSGGKIVIHFYSPEEARGIVSRMKPQDLF